MTLVAILRREDDADRYAEARQAHRDYGQGSGHPARLNLGDCFAYALARATGEPLLYKGDHFAATDLQSALAPPHEDEVNEREAPRT